MYHIGDLVRLKYLRKEEQYISQYLTVGKCYVISDMNRSVVGLENSKGNTWYIAITDIENVTNDPTGWDMP